MGNGGNWQEPQDITPESLKAFSLPTRQTGVVGRYFGADLNVE